MAAGARRKALEAGIAELAERPGLIAISPWPLGLHPIRGDEVVHRVRVPSRDRVAPERHLHNDKDKPYTSPFVVEQVPVEW